MGSEMCIRDSNNTYLYIDYTSIYYPGTALSPFLYCFTMSMWVGGSLRTCPFLVFGLGAAAFRVDRAWRGNVCLEDQAKACSHTDQPVRKSKYSSGINMTMLFYLPDRVIFGYPYSSTIMERRLRRMVPVAAVPTHAKPHAQQQLARDLELELWKGGARCHGAARSTFP